MNKRAALGKALEYGIEVGGGALAGFLDAKYPDKQIQGFGLGTVAAAAGLAVGILGFGGRWGRYAGDVGAGAAAFEVGKMVASKTSASSVAVTSSLRGRTSGVGALPAGGRRVSQADIRQAMRELASL